MKNKKGITLVSLVVTIIVLIILAGVSINLTLGENGIITMAKKARENMELAKENEERKLNELYMQMEQEGLSGEISYDAIAKLVEFKREIASAITDMGVETAENADATTMSSNIRSLTVASSADKISYDNTNSKLVATNVQEAVDELNDSLGEDVNGMTVHEKLDYIMGNNSSGVTLKENSKSINAGTKEISCKVGDIIVINTYYTVTYEGCNYLTKNTTTMNNANNNTFILQATKEKVTLTSNGTWYYFVIG